LFTTSTQESYVGCGGIVDEDIVRPVLHFENIAELSDCKLYPSRI